MLILSGLFTALTALGAWLKIPFYPVPLTLQTLFTMLAGSLLAPQYAAVSQIVYLLLGLIGFPIFANGGGLGYIFQPTFGYLLSLPVAAFFISLMLSIKKTDNILYLFAINFFSVIIILLFGALWLYFSINFFLHKTFTMQNALYSGVFLFLPGGLIKALMATVIAKALANRFKNLREF